MNSPSWAEINLDALKNNFAVAKNAAPTSKVMAVIKADAYGHGALECANALTEADAYAVAHLDEALALRDAGIHKDIVVLNGIHNFTELHECTKQKLTPVIHSYYLFRELDQNITKPLKVWLKLDTGMHRLGMTPGEISQCITALSHKPHVQLEGLMSHLSDSEIPDHTANKSQIDLLHSISDKHDCKHKSLANSGGILFHPESHMEWVRPGIMLYGSNPGTHENAATELLQPVMSLKSIVIATRNIPAGDTTGYSGRWTAKRDSRIATIAIGYADGYQRIMPDDTPVAINGKLYPLAGKVSMDLITVDITDDTEQSIKPGQVAELWGEHIAANTIAERANTISYELFTGVSKRVPRVYKAQKG